MEVCQWNSSSEATRMRHLRCMKQQRVSRTGKTSNLLPNSQWTAPKRRTGSCAKSLPHGHTGNGLSNGRLMRPHVQRRKKSAFSTYLDANLKLGPEVRSIN